MPIIQHPSAAAGFLRGTVRRALAHRSTAVQEAAADVAVGLHAEGHSGHRSLSQSLDWADTCHDVPPPRGVPAMVQRLRKQIPAHRYTGDDGPKPAA